MFSVLSLSSWSRPAPKKSTSARAIGCLHDYDCHDDDDDDDDDHADNDNDIDKDTDTERSTDGKAQTCRQSQQF